jgi:YtkA-like protein
VTFGRENFLTRGRLLLAAVACAGALLGVACRLTEPTPDVLVEHEISPSPPRVGATIVNLKLTDFAASKPLSGARVRLEGNMTHAGMPPVFADAKELEPGRYRATLELTMGGDWVILIHIVRPDGSQVERQLDVKGVRAD